MRRMKAAGAIVLGKSSCSDLSGSMETDNPISGLTRNPWRLERSAGGSRELVAELLPERF